MTRDGRKVSLRNDPCFTLLWQQSRGTWSDRHGLVERHSTLVISGSAADTRDLPAYGIVTEHDPQIPPLRGGRATVQDAGQAQLAGSVFRETFRLACDRSQEVSQAEADGEADPR